MRLNSLLIAMLCLICLPGCRDGARKDIGKLQVVATTSMIGDVARVIGGEDVEVESLMGPGIDPHLYKASEGDLRRIEAADLLLYNGLHLEARMGQVFEQIGKSGRPVVAVAEALPVEKLLESSDYENSYDPHIWFDISLWKLASAATGDALANAAATPQKAAAIRKRSEAYQQELDKLEGDVRAMIDRVPKEQRVLITAHDAFNYFGRAYEFEVRGLQGISTAAEAGARDVDTLAAFIAERNIPAIFVESSVSPRTIQALKEAAGARGQNVAIGGELFSDALGDPPGPAGTYIGMMRHNVETITNALITTGTVAR